MRSLRILMLLVAALTALSTASGCASHPAAPDHATGATATVAEPEFTAPPVKDQRALNELKMMSEALTSAKTLSFDSSSLSPLHGPNGQWVHVLKTAKVQMRRPDKLAITTGGDAVPQRIVFDGKTYSASATDKHLFTQVPIAGNIDAMLAEVAKQGGDAFSFSDVLLADPLSSWTKELEGASYVGESVRNGEKLSHVAFTEKDEHWEVFASEKDHLPRIVYVKYVSLRHVPSVLIEFSNWKLGPRLADSTFAFKPPAGAKKAALKAPTSGGDKQ